MGANLILPAGSAAADSTPADPVTRSLRFNDAGDSHLYFDPTATHDSSTVYTFSCWAKLGEMDAETYEIFTAGHYTSSTNQDLIYFGHDSNSKLRVWLRSTVDGENTTYRSTAVFRDPSAWYHLLLVRNGASLKVYVNNTEVISETISSTQRYGVGNGYPMHIGSSVKPTSSSISSYASFDGLIADVYFTDGYAKAPTDFIESNNYGGYIPKEYTGEFGTNGFHLDAQPSNSADLLVSSVGRNDGDTTFVDVAAGHTITSAGDPEHSIAVGNPFTGDDRAITFDGTSDMLEIASSSDFQFGTGDFTIEGWYNFRHLTGDQVICDLRPSNVSDSTRPSFSTDGAGLKMHFAGSNTPLASSGLVIGKWHHIEISRSSNTLYCFIDGTQTYSSTFSSNLNTDCTPHLGSTDTNSQVAFLDGHVFDYHILKGFGRHTSNFTVPTEKSTKDSTYTVLLLQPDKDDTGFDDLSDSGHDITATGSPTRTASTPFDAAAKSSAMYFDGAGDRVIANHSSDFNFGTGAFTIEMWHKHISSVNGSSGSSNVTGDIVISKGKWNTSIKGWLFKTVNYGTDVLDFDMYMGDGSFSNQVNLSANSSGVSTVHDGDWHHIAITRDGSGNMGLFVDGTRVANETGTGYNFDATSYGLRIGAVYGYDNAESNYANCYLYDVRVTKGEAKYDPTSTSVTAPSAPFELNPVYIGGDQSGNKNHFTPTNISQAHDVMLDTPTLNYAVLNPLAETKTDSSTYDANPTTGLSEGNLKLTSSSKWYNGHGTLGVSSGKWYFEWYSTGDYVLGGFSTSEMFSNSSQSETDWWVLYNRDSSNNIELRYKDGTSTAGTAWAGGSHASGNGNVYGCAFDVDNRKMYFHKNGEWSDGTSTLTSTFPSSYGGDLTGSSHNIPADTTFYPIVRAFTSSTVIANFGQDSTFANTVASGSANAADGNGNGDFRYTPPSGYLALCTANLDAPTVTPEENFNTRPYFGSRDNSASIGATSPSVTGMGFEANLLWIKDRDNASSSYGSGYYGHFLFDAVQGTGKAINIDGGMYTGSNDFSSNLDGYNGVSSFDSDGFTVDEAEAVNYAYDSDYNGSLNGYERYVAWGWKLGSNGSSSTWASGNTDPTTEKYNASAGVSVIRQEETSGNYPMTGVTVNHSLGAAPEFAFLADTSGNTQNVYAWHKDLAANKYLRLNANSAQTTGSGYFPSGCSTATTFQIGGDIAGSNGYDGWWDIYMYLFTSVEGMVKVGSWVGNGDDDGPMVYCGFRPSLILAKAVNRSNSWYMWDDQRDGYNVTDAAVWADLSNAESNASTNKVDILSNGFKLRGSGNGTNSSTDNNYIFIAWAHSPFSKANSF